LLLFAIDTSLIGFGFLGAGAIRLGSPFELQSLKTVAVVLPVFIGVAANNRAYSIRALQRPAYGAMKVAEALAYAIAVAIALLFFAKASVQFSRQIFAMGTVLAVAFAVIGRLALGVRIHRKYKGELINRLVIVDGVHMLDDYDYRPSAGEVVLSAVQLGIGSKDNDPSSLDRLGHALSGCDGVVVLCSASKRAKWSDVLKFAAVNVEIVTPELDQFQAIRLGDFNGHRTLQVNARPLDIRACALKRSLDLVVAVSALILFAPLMALIATATLVESGRPIFFRQRRVGKNNRMFDVLKFRSFAQAHSDPAGERSTSRGDQRMTSVGRFIRRTSVDELPQLFNVIAGDMSIVGPRPHALGSTAEDALFWNIDPRYFHRHAVKPGMTGLAQVRGYRGATIRRGDLTNRLQSDLEYLCGWTIWRDLKIIVATFAVILHPNAF
jgi:exopolysaccharide biosynthesis polyprenyl glycosylphosphotransferase